MASSLFGMVESDPTPGPSLGARDDVTSLFGMVEADPTPGPSLGARDDMTMSLTVNAAGSGDAG